MTSSVFPDVNVWVALSAPDHEHFLVAWKWYTHLPADASLVFCRHTQLGLLRLLTTQSAMGASVLTQTEAWLVYDQWKEAGGGVFMEEPPDIETRFRSYTASAQAAPKEWADAYLAAFSTVARVQLVTFDRALSRKATGAVLLSS